MGNTATLTSSTNRRSCHSELPKSESSAFERNCQAVMKVLELFETRKETVQGLRSGVPP